jgi:hypothetical protein
MRAHPGYLSGDSIVGFTEEPPGRDHTLEVWLANLPPLKVAVKQVCIMQFLGVIHGTKLGDNKDEFKQPPVADSLHGFQRPCRRPRTRSSDETPAATDLRLPAAVAVSERHQHLASVKGLAGRGGENGWPLTGHRELLSDALTYADQTIGLPGGLIS